MKYYVYHLIDPRDNKVFYVGKGTGSRISDHEDDARLCRGNNVKKESRIIDIWKDGFQVVRHIERYFGMEAAAYQFEKNEIWRIGHDNLTNNYDGITTDHARAIYTADHWLVGAKRLSHIISCPIISGQLASLIAEMEENKSFALKQLGGVKIYNTPT